MEKVVHLSCQVLGNILFHDEISPGADKLPINSTLALLYYHKFLPIKAAGPG